MSHLPNKSKNGDQSSDSQHKLLFADSDKRLFSPPEGETENNSINNNTGNTSALLGESGASGNCDNVGGSSRSEEELLTHHGVSIVNIDTASNTDEGDSSSSLESDYYYDDDGKSHTYYRPKRYPSRNTSQRHTNKTSHRQQEQEHTNNCPRRQDANVVLKRKRRKAKAEKEGEQPAHHRQSLHSEPFADDEDDNKNIGNGENPVPTSAVVEMLPLRNEESRRVENEKNEYLHDNGSIYIALPPPTSVSHVKKDHDEVGKSDEPIECGGGDADVADSDNAVVRRNTTNISVLSAGTTTTVVDDDDVKNAKKDLTHNPSTAVRELPRKLQRIGHKLDTLPTDELLYISAMVSRKAYKEVYSVLQYTGEAWYLPEIRRTRPGEDRWGVNYQLDYGLVLTIAGRRVRLRLFSYFIRLALIALIWFVFWSSTIPKAWSYRVGYLLDPYTTVLVATILGGLTCRLLAIPPLVGIFAFGIMWNNIGPEVGYFTAGILPQVKTITARSGLAIIVLRAGYSINIRSVTPIVGNVVLNASTLGIESVLHALVAQFYLGFNDWTWAFCQGITCAVPAAAIVVPGCLLLQADGYSRSSGPLPLMLATMGIETPLGIWAASFVFGLISSDKSIGYLAGMCPVQIFGGIAVGLICALILHIFVWMLRKEADRLPTGKYTEAHTKRVHRLATIFLLLAGHALLFLGYEIELAGGGVVATLVTSFTLSNYWGLGNDPEWMEMKSHVGAGLASMWDILTVPYLFSIAGSKVVLSQIFNKTHFPKALVCVIVSLFTKFFFTGMGSLGLGFTWKERLFHMGAATSKATIQIALGSNPIDFVNKKLAATAITDPLREDLLKQKEMAQMIQTTCFLSVIVCAPLASIWITRLGPLVLKKE